MTQATYLRGGARPGSAADRTADRARHAARRRRALQWIAVHALGIAAAAFFILPFVFVLLTALMSDNQALTRDLWPHPFVWSNFSAVWHTPGFLTWWRNTLLYAV